MNWIAVSKWVMWNAMLALIPVGVGYGFRAIVNSRAATALRYSLSVVAGAVWFVFLPNTCYLLTEWRHFLMHLDAKNLFLRSRTDHVYLIELVLFSLFYFLYSSFGMITFAMAIRPVKRVASQRGLPLSFWAFPFFALISLGVYLGLILRFNSWDLLTKPGMIWQAIVEVGDRPVLMAFIGGFGIFLWIAYEALDIWIDGIKMRLDKNNRRDS
ncbi:MAG: DUF1361 domain-containing protein [Armatimonadetes bacterium]|jgi:uncharacterized membrane protein|nr:DUF1361 domain-containing protein [Armatimonadota bacterium]